tara:strand:+ start:241 stop:774 length:534 start_codon:yes stop_codon:yes gene_type:complete
MNLKIEKSLYSRNLVLKDATEDDAAFLLKLRKDIIKSRYLSPTSNSLEDQKMWMQAYRDKVDEAYFIIQNKSGDRLGCVRMYNPVGSSFQWGSWLIVNGTSPNVALESALLIYSYARRLGFTKAKINVTQKNINVWKFHENVFNAMLINQNSVERFYEVSEKTIDDKLLKHRKLLVT